MRILMATPGYPPQVGGVERVAYNLAQEYVRRGHQVAVVAPNFADEPTSSTVERVEVHRLPYPMPQRSPRDILEFACRFPFADIAFNRLVGTFRPDVINSHFAATTNSLYAIHAAERHKLPLVVSLHGGDVETMPYKSTCWRITSLAALRCAQGLTACSDYLRVSAGKLAEEAYRAKVVRNGVNAEEFASCAADREEPFFLGMGRLVREKGFDILLDAFRSVVSARPDLRLVLVGGGPEEYALKTQAESLGVMDNVVFRSGESRRAVIHTLQASMAVVVPSRSEALGIVNLEAMAAGKAVIAAAVGGVPEVVRDRETGILVPPEDPEALAAAMIEIAANVELRRKLGANGRKKVVAEHSWSSAASDYLDCYSAAISAKQSLTEVKN